MRKSIAYQSLHASPIAFDWKLLRAGSPFGSLTSRCERPCVYSW